MRADETHLERVKGCVRRYADLLSEELGSPSTGRFGPGAEAAIQ